MKKNYYFLEYFDSSLDLTGAEIIALTPEVMCPMDQLNISYKIIEDYVSVEDQPNLIDYQESFCKLIIECDTFIRQRDYRINQNRLTDIFLLNSYQLNTILSPIVLIAYRLEKMIKTLNPYSVTYIRKNSIFDEADYFDLEKRRNIGEQKSLNCVLTETICQQMGILFNDVVLQGKNNINVNIKIITSIKQTIKTYIKSLILLSMRYIKQCGLKKKNTLYEGLNLFFTDNSYDSKELIKESTPFDIRCFIDDEDIFKKVISKKQYIQKEKIKGLYPADREIICHKIIKWLNRYSKLDVSSIFKKNINQYLKRFYLKSFLMTRYYIDFYERNKIDYVILPAIAKEKQYAAFLATKLTNNENTPKRVLIFHGNGAYSIEPLWHLDLQCTDLFFVPDDEMVGYFKNFRLNVSDEFPNLFRIFQGSPRTQSYIKCSKNSYSIQQKNKKKLVCCYIHAFYYGSQWRPDRVDYSDTWYYRFQKKLIKFFSKQINTEFIYKTLPNIRNPILPLIESSNYANIKVSTKSLDSILKHVDCVIADVPSTGFYQAQFAKIPSLCIYPAFCVIREKAVDYLGKSVFVFKEDKQIFPIMESFLSCPNKEYIVNIPFREKSILNTLYYEKQKTNVAANNLF